MDAVLNWLWQGGVVVAALSMMLFTLRRARANVRYVVCWTAALFVIVLPLIPSLQPAAPVDAIGVSGSDAIVALPEAWWTSTRVILGVAMLWVAINVVRLQSAVFAIRRARQRTRPFPVHLESALPHWRRLRDQGRRATLVLSDSVTSAAVLGWGAPLIAVAPSLASTLEPDDLDRVLIHEWAHVQRRDDVVNVLQIGMRFLAGWHPAMWWIERRLHVEREIACDETTVAITGLPKPYAQCLMKLSELKAAAHAVQAAPAIFTRSGLRARVVKIVSPPQPIAPMWSRAIAAAMVLGLCLLSAAVSGVSLVEATEFAEPVLSAATVTLSIPLHRPEAVETASSSNTKTQASPGRTAARAFSSQRPAPGPQALPQPEAAPASRELQTPNPQTPVHAMTPPQAADAALQPGPLAARDVTTVPLTPQVLPVVKAETPRSPWAAAAAGGATIGRKSKDAGVATAGFFSRFGRRVADSF